MPAVHTHALETPEQVYARFLKFGMDCKLGTARAEMFARGKQRQQSQQVLGLHDHLTEQAAHFMASCLRMKRMPPGVARWVAQQCLETWLPFIHGGERADIVAKLRKCSPAQLGPDLVAIIAAQTSA